MTRVLNADDWEDDIFTVDQEIWSDYDGDEIYGDFTVHQDGGGPPEAKQERSFVMGLATVGWTDNPQGQRVPDDPSLRYYHADMIGTTRFMTDFIGDPGEDTVFTAFGERIDGTPRRFGYAGSWGYQSTLDDGTPPTEVFPFLHVGARYYDPATGRFLQRDPIGIAGGLNVYAYLNNSPTHRVDPDGLAPYRDALGRFARAPWWRRTALRAGPIGLCGWLAIEITERIIVPAIDDWADKNYDEGMDEINNPPPPPPPLRGHDDDGDEENDSCVG